jgi:hypothetical protein
MSPESARYGHSHGIPRAHIRRLDDPRLQSPAWAAAGLNKMGSVAHTILESTASVLLILDWVVFVLYLIRSSYALAKEKFT